MSKQTIKKKEVVPDFNLCRMQSYVHSGSVDNVNTFNVDIIYNKIKKWEPIMYLSLIRRCFTISLTKNGWFKNFPGQNNFLL